MIKLAVFTDHVDNKYVQKLVLPVHPRLIFVTTQKEYTDLQLQHNVTVLNCQNLKVVSSCLNSGKLPESKLYCKSNTVKDLKKQLYSIRYKEVKVYVEGLLFRQHTKRESLVEQNVLA